MRSCLSSIVFSTVVLLSMSALTECSSRSNFPEVLGSAMPWFGTERRGAPNNISRDRRWGLRGQKKGRREAQMASVVAQFEDVDDSGEAVAEEHPLKSPDWVIHHKDVSNTLPRYDHVTFSNNGDVVCEGAGVVGHWEFPPSGNGVKWTVKGGSQDDDDGVVLNYFASFFDNYIGGQPKMVKGVVTKGNGKWFRPVVATFNARAEAMPCSISKGVKDRSGDDNNRQISNETNDK